MTEIINTADKSNHSGSDNENSKSPFDAGQIWSSADYPGREASADHPRREANSEILDILQHDVNQSLGLTPNWVPRQMRNPDPHYQCASTASNIYREVLKHAGLIDSANSPSYRDLYQVLVPSWVGVMQKKGLATEIPRSAIRPGDAVVGIGDTEKRRQNNDRHVGFVGEYDAEHNQFAAYSNADGILAHQMLDTRFGHYRNLKFYRLRLPE
jgi:hypothetical protein